jgi:hypothetical protein
MAQEKESYGAQISSVETLFKKVPLKNRGGERQGVEIGVCDCDEGFQNIIWATRFTVCLSNAALKLRNNDILYLYCVPFSVTIFDVTVLSVLRLRQGTTLVCACRLLFKPL